MSIDEQSEPVQPDYDTLKKQLEVEKLNKEIKQLDLEISRKWYRKPQWIAALSPAFLGILTITVAFATGLLQNQSTLNKIQEENFNSRKQAINDSINALEHLADSLSEYTVKLRFERNNLDSLLNKLNLAQDTLSDQLAQKNSRITNLTMLYNKAKDGKALAIIASIFALALESTQKEKNNLKDSLNQVQKSNVELDPLLLNDSIAKPHKN